jgi:PST family polysaccharide transporter
MLVDEPEDRNEILGSALVLRGIGGIATTLIAVLAMQLLNVPQAVKAVTPLLAAITLFQSFDVVEYWLRLRLKSRYGVAARMAALSLGAALRIFALRADNPLVALAWAVLLESTLVACGMIFAARLAGATLRDWRPRLARASVISRQSMPISVSAVAVAIYVRFGFLILGNARGPREVGLLSVASVMAEALHAPAAAVAASYGPILLAKRQQSQVDFDLALPRLLRWAWSSSILIAALVSLASPLVVPLVFGQSYVQSVPVFAILVWSIVFVYLSVASELWFIGHGLQRYLLPKTLMAAALYVALNYAVVPHFGARGVAAVTLLTYSFSAFWSNLIFPRTRPLFYRQARALMLWT